MTYPLSSSATINIDSFPYRHAVVERAFPKTIADRIAQYHRSRVHKAAHAGKLEDIGEKLYSARFFTPDLTDLASSGLSVLLSDALRLLVGGMLGVTTNDCIRLHCHRHDPPSKDGIPHTDCGIVSYPPIDRDVSDPEFNGMSVYQPDTGVNYADDSRDRQPNSRKMARSLSCIYYLGNHDWQPGDGGETAIYAQDETTIVKRVPPLHNSLFVFDTSPISYHGYLASSRKVRDSIIWWYHDDMRSVVKRHQKKFDRIRVSGKDPWTRVTPATVPKYEPPPQ